MPNLPNPIVLAFTIPAFNSYKEYDRAETAVTITGSISAGQTATFGSTVSFSRNNSIASMEFTTSATSVFNTTGLTYMLYAGTSIQHSDGSTPTFPGTAVYTVNFQNAFATDFVTLTAVVANPSSETLTLVNETITISFYSFIAPFHI